MPVAAAQAYPQRWPRRLLGGGLAALLLAGLSLAPYLQEPTELVRLRNALLLQPGVYPAAAFDWSGDAAPPDFVHEVATDPFFVQQAAALGLDRLDNDWERVLAISRQLLSHHPLVGTPLQADLHTTYAQILQQGRGYCGDFTRVFMALALSVGMPVRAWSFSLDGFGGEGHVWPEIWNRQLRQWQLVDVFNNSYFVGADGLPLSALALRLALQRPYAEQTGVVLRLLPLVPQARPGYEEEARAWHYYRSGLAEWYLAWGNNVFSNDQPPLLQGALAPLSRALQELHGMASGVAPRLRILAEPRNSAQRAALQRLRWHVLWAAAVAAGGLLAMALGALGLLLPRLRRGRPMPAPAPDAPSRAAQEALTRAKREAQPRASQELQP